MNNHTKNQRKFIRKLTGTSFPFKTILESNKVFKKQLFDEFVKTKPKPDLYLYTEQYVTGKEIQADWLASHSYSPAMETRLNDISAEFYKKYKTIDHSFLSFDLEATETVKTLKDIESKRTILQNEVFEDEGTIHFQKRAKGFANSIYRLLIGLENQLLAIDVFNAILSDNENIQLVIRAMNGDCNPEYNRKHQLLKIAFDNHLSKIFLPTTQRAFAATLKAESTERNRLGIFSTDEGNERLAEIKGLVTVLPSLSIITSVASQSLEDVWELRKVESRANFVATKQQSHDQTVEATDRPSMGCNFAFL